MKPIAARPPTIKEVAKLADVSFKTVARVVNNEPSVKADKREAVLRAMKMLNYRPNISARQLAGKRSYLLALVFDIAAAYVARAQTGAIARCREVGYHLIVEEAPRGFEVAVADRLLALKVDGVIVTPPVSQREPFLTALRERNIRHVAISPNVGEGPAPTVSMDDRLAARQLVEVLIGQGHRDIAFISGGARAPASRRRRAGYIDALEGAGLPRRADREADGDFTFKTGEEVAHRLLTTAPRPTAIFAANDSMALGVMVAAARLGVRVPDELSVVGFDDAPAASVVWPRLTTVSQPLERMAAAAVDLLLAPEAAEPPAPVMIDFEIMMRESLGPAPKC